MRLGCIICCILVVYYDYFTDKLNTISAIATVVGCLHHCIILK